MRVVSLLPSATEIVALVGGEQLLVGRSHECNYPPSVEKLPALTAAKTAFVNSKQMNDAVTKTLASGSGLYVIDEALLKKLEPDVIVTQSVCAVCSVDYQMVKEIASRMSKKPAIVDLNPQSLEDVIDGCIAVGSTLGKKEEADEVVGRLRERVQRVLQYVSTQSIDHPAKVAFLEWVDPIFVGGHWTPQLIHMAGGKHPLNLPKENRGAGSSYAISNVDFASSDPDWIVICPCGLNIEETKREMQSIEQTDWWKQLRAVREGRTVIVDGDQMFNRPGPRLVDALEWLVGLLHNDGNFLPASFPWMAISTAK